MIILLISKVGLFELLCSFLHCYSMCLLIPHMSVLFYIPILSQVKYCRLSIGLFNYFHLFGLLTMCFFCPSNKHKTWLGLLGSHSAFRNIKFSLTYLYLWSLHIVIMYNELIKFLYNNHKYIFICGSPTYKKKDETILYHPQLLRTFVT